MSYRHPIFVTQCVVPVARKLSIRKTHLASIGHISMNHHVTSITRKICAKCNPEIRSLCVFKFLRHLTSSGEFESRKALFGDDIDDTGHGIRTVGRGSTTCKYLYSLYDPGRNKVQIHSAAVGEGGNQSRAIQKRQRAVRPKTP